MLQFCRYPITRAVHAVNSWSPSTSKLSKTAVSLSAGSAVLDIVGEAAHFNGKRLGSGLIG